MADFTSGGEAPVLDASVFESGEPEQKTEESAETPEKSEEKSVEPDVSGVEQTLTALKEEMAYLKAENDLIRTQLLVSQQPATPPVEEKPVSKEDLRTRLTEDPVATIEELIEKKVSGVKAETSETIRLSEMKQDDQRKTVNEFGEFLNDPEFQTHAEAAYKEIVGADEWKPNALYLAASVAFSKMAKKGTLKKKSKTPDPAGVGGESEQTEGKAAAANGVKFSQSELATIDRVCKRWGITREKYMESFSKAQKRDPSFGKVG